MVGWRKEASPSHDASYLVSSQPSPRFSGCYLAREYLDSRESLSVEIKPPCVVHPRDLFLSGNILNL